MSSRRLTHAVLHRALGDAVRWRKIARNPADDADPPRLGRTRVEAWTESELRRFLAHVEHDRLFALYRLDAVTGARRGELLGLCWRDLDFDAARLRIERQALPTKGAVTFGDVKSDGRTVKLDAGTIDALRHHLEVQKLERDLAGEAYEDNDLIFCNEVGQVIQPRRLSEWFTKHRKDAGIPTGSIHVLRHTYATLALSKGVDLTTVARRIGDDEVTVLRTYSHAVPWFVR